MMLYADPGSGVLIWQLLLALFFGATFYFSKFKAWASSILRPVRKDETLKTLQETYTSKSVSKGE